MGDRNGNVSWGDGSNRAQTTKKYVSELVMERKAAKHESFSLPLRRRDQNFEHIIKKFQISLYLHRLSIVSCCDYDCGDTIDGDKNEEEMENNLFGDFYFNLFYFFAFFTLFLLIHRLRANNGPDSVECESYGATKRRERFMVR